MLDELKIMLGDKAELFTDAQLELALKQAVIEVETYCNRKVDAELELFAQRIAIIRLNRTNTEGLAGASFSGVSENYVDGYPADILAALNRKRKVKIL